MLVSTSLAQGVCAHAVIVAPLREHAECSFTNGFLQSVSPCLFSAGTTRTLCAPRRSTST
eukprot:4725295-Prorocentrum_lima.AAC.1